MHAPEPGRFKTCPAETCTQRCGPHSPHLTSREAPVVTSASLEGEDLGGPYHTGQRVSSGGALGTPRRSVTRWTIPEFNNQATRLPSGSAAFRADSLRALAVSQTLEGPFPVVQSLRPASSRSAVLGALQRFLGLVGAPLSPTTRTLRGPEGPQKHGKDTGRSRTDNADSVEASTSQARKRAPPKGRPVSLFPAQPVPHPLYLIQGVPPGSVGLDRVLSSFGELTPACGSAQPALPLAGTQGPHGRCSAHHPGCAQIDATTDQHPPAAAVEQGVAHTGVSHWLAPRVASQLRRERGAKYPSVSARLSCTYVL